MEIKKVTAQKADSYKYTAEKAGLKISVDPYREEDRLKEFFGCDLLSRGVLPVLVVFENKSAEDGYIFIKEKSGLLMTNPDSRNTSNNLANESYKSDNLDRAVKTETATTGLTLATMGGIMAAGALPGLILYVPAGIAQEKAKEEFVIMRNFEDKKLVDKTVYQGSSNNGFIYFRINSNEDISKIVGIQLCTKNIRSKEIVTLVIPINE